ncbi:MAG TPA: ParB/RepB/Spo0J family partition protein [Solirubrobacterales bacterium]|jgi:ParB/RepB/Spo0J family partition protein|nr:ParB/RepB/Spo0J family partition protein [Solirubrobacterales bacterium]
MSTQLATPEVAIDKIDVVEGFNSRRDFDPDDLTRLAETIKADGLVAPVDVRPGEKAGRFVLVAGERRYRAAKLAGLKKIPVSVGKGNPRAAAFVENHHRADLNPIETALDLRAYAEEFGLTSNKKIAGRAKVNPAWVGDHLRLLKLPEQVQRYVAAGDVPITAEPKLRKIAAVSPEVAAFICEVARKNGISGAAFVERFGELVEAAGGSEAKDAPTMIRVRGFRLSEAVADKARRRELAGRIDATLPEYRQGEEDPMIQFGDEEVDAARAAGCLVEYQSERRHYVTTYAYVTDAEFATDLIERSVERREREIEAAAVAETEAKAEKKDEQQKLREERKASGEKSPQAKAKERKAIARRFNESLKLALLRKRTVARRRKYALSRAQAVAVQLIADNPELAGRGLRLVSDQLQDLEVRQLKNGKSREKVLYADKEQSNAELLRRALGTKDPLEVIEVLAEALLAGIVADGEEVANKDHIGWSTPVDREIEKIMATEIKEVRPRRASKPH